MRPTTALLTSVLLVTCVASCTTTRTVYVTEPLDCAADVPQQPVLPAINKGELWDALGDDAYRRLELYLNTLWGYADEQAATLNTLCGP